jgi:hypothetical protein
VEKFWQATETMSASDRPRYFAHPRPMERNQIELLHRKVQWVAVG